MNSTFTQSLRRLLEEEAFAYGFTIAFWGSGLLLIEEFGLLHTVSILEFATGAITGFGVLAVATFSGAADTVAVDSPPSIHVLAVLHYLATLVPIGITHFMIAAPLGKGLTLFLTGILVSVGYNVFALLQELISEAVLTVEQRQG